MNLSKFSMLFLIIFTAAIAPIIWATQVSSVTSLMSEEIREDLITASYDTTKSVEIKDGFAFKTTTQRNEALDTFYTSLASAYGLTAAGGIPEATVTTHIPFVALIDNDGVYVCYSRDYNDWGKMNKLAYKITPITTYATSYTVSTADQYTVHFTLTGEATVYHNGIKVGNGTYKELLRKLSPTDKSILEFMSSEAKFNEEKQIVVTNVVIRTVENYINKEIASNKKDNSKTKTGWNLHNTQYQVVIPQDQKADFANALNSPTVMSFYQGEQMQTGTTYSMSVALAGGEVGTEELFYVVEDSTGTLYYHSALSCPRFLAHKGAMDPSTGTYLSEQKKYPMEKAASLGAYPCPDCVH